MLATLSPVLIFLLCALAPVVKRGTGRAPLFGTDKGQFHEPADAEGTATLGARKPIPDAVTRLTFRNMTNLKYAQSALRGCYPLPGTTTAVQIAKTVAGNGIDQPNGNRAD
jgi:hypothetical protein